MLDRSGVLLKGLYLSFKNTLGINKPISSIKISNTFNGKVFNDYKVLQITFKTAEDVTFYDSYYSSVFFFLKEDMNGEWYCNNLMTYVVGFDPKYIDIFNVCAKEVTCFFNSLVEYKDMNLDKVLIVCEER